MKNRRRDQGTTENRLDGVEYEVRENTKAIELLNERLKPFTNTEIAVKWLSRFIIWASGICGSIAVIWHLLDKIKGHS